MQTDAVVVTGGLLLLVLFAGAVEMATVATAFTVALAVAKVWNPANSLKNKWTQYIVHYCISFKLNCTVVHYTQYCIWLMSLWLMSCLWPLLLRVSNGTSPAPSPCPSTGAQSLYLAHLFLLVFPLLDELRSWAHAVRRPWVLPRLVVSGFLRPELIYSLAKPAVC